MANKKVRSFADYNAARVEREGNIKTRIDRELECLIVNELRRGEFHFSVGISDFTHHPRDVFRAILAGPDRFLQWHVQKRKGELKMEVAKTFYLDLFQENISDLVRCSTYLSKRKEGFLSREERQELFVRVIDELELMRNNPFHRETFCEIKDLGYLMNRYHLPEDEEGLRRMRNVINDLRKEGYIPSDNTEKLFCFLTAQPPESKSAHSKPPVPLVSSVLSIPFVPSYHSARHSHPVHPDQSEEIIEYLTILGISEESAAPYVGEMKLNDLKEFYEGLENNLGGRTAGKFFQEYFPALLPYVASGAYTKHLTTLSKIQQRLGEHGGKKLERRFGFKRHEKEYASLNGLEELKRKLFEETGGYNGEKKTDRLVNDGDDYTYIFHYAIMQKNPIMEERLSSLIEEGELVISRHEHWMGDKSKGLRGRNILKEIRTELNYLFGNLSYHQLFGVPQHYKSVCEINFGQHKLLIKPWAQTVLQRVRKGRDEYLKDKKTG